MAKKPLRDIVARIASEEGVTETGLEGLKLYRVSAPVHRIPAVYTPRFCLNVSGSKRVFQNNKVQVYGENCFVCCTMPLPVEAEVPKASPRRPLLGVLLEFDEQLMTETVIEMSSAVSEFRNNATNDASGLVVGDLTDCLQESLLRLLRLVDDSAEMKVLGKGRIKEVYFALLKTEAGSSVSHRYGRQNEIVRTISYLKDNLQQSFTIDELAKQAGMSRAVFHRRFKEATTLSPVQYVKALRLNTAAMHLAMGTGVNQAAYRVGYASPSQFSREFKRQFGVTPREWEKDAKFA